MRTGLLPAAHWWSRLSLIFGHNHKTLLRFKLRRLLPGGVQGDIAAGEELCYDYRFAGEQRLPCNCGAASCRRFVNEPRGSSGGGGGGLLRVPEADLRPVKASDFWQDT